MRILHRGGRTVVRFGRGESAWLAGLLRELVDLVDDGSLDDPLAGLGTPRARPLDPALARLLPDGYRAPGATDPTSGGGPDVDEEFRRLTEGDLRAGKREAARTVLAALPPGSATGSAAQVALEPPQVEVWIGALNDLRLALGARLGLFGDPPSVPPDAVRASTASYDVLTWLQDGLVSEIM